MKKIIPFVLAAVIAIGVYSCQKESVSKSSPSGALEKTKKDTTPPAASFKVQKDTTPPAAFTTVARDTTPPAK